MTSRKACSVYRGVSIFRKKTIIPGSDFKELKSGRMKECKPKFDTAFKYAGSYPYPTLKECKEAIKHVYAASVASGGTTDPREFAAIMNEEIHYDK